MPTYGYLCDCGQLEEVFQSMLDGASNCNSCGKLMHRKPAVLGVSFEGHGWGGDKNE
jgi:putative FmdB family regulatory protein